VNPTMRKAFDDIVRGVQEVELDDDECSFKLNPPSDQVELLLRKVGASTARKPLRLRPLTTTGIVSLDSLDEAEYDVEVYSSATEPPLLLHQFSVFKSDDKGLSLRSVSVPATVLETCFRKSNAPLSGAQVSGKFVDANGNPFALRGRTDIRGFLNMVLPPGTIDNLTATQGSTTVQKKGRIRIPAPQAPSSGRTKPMSIVIDVDSSTFSGAINPTDENAKILVLGDVSGSMGGGGKMDILKRSFVDIVKKCEESNVNVSLASWDSWIEWSSNSWAPAKLAAVQDWIQNRQARGGNDMRYAIEDAMRHFPDATDVYVMCDGDTSPFVPEGGRTTGVDVDVPKPKLCTDESVRAPYADTDWPTFRARFPKTIFHFVALGQGAATDALQEMAASGGGDYWEST
jgi:hypothetical protein